MTDERISSLAQEEFVQLPEPSDPPPSEATTKTQDVYRSISDIIDNKGKVDFDQIQDASESEDPFLITQGPLEILEDQNFADVAADVAQDPNTSLAEKFQQLESLSAAARDADRPVQKARSTVAAIEAQKAPNDRQATRAEALADAIQERESLRNVISDQRDSVKQRFEEGQWVERTTEFLASEILPTGWVKSGHFDPAKLVSLIAPEVNVNLADVAFLGDTFAEARDIIAALPPEERLRRAKAARGYMRQIEGTFGTDNKFEADRLTTMFAGLFGDQEEFDDAKLCLLYTSPSPRDKRQSRMPSSA